jgi:hypothetical protein
VKGRPVPFFLATTNYGGTAHDRIYQAGLDHTTGTAQALADGAIQKLRRLRPQTPAETHRALGQTSPTGGASSDYDSCLVRNGLPSQHAFAQQHPRPFLLARY